MPHLHLTHIQREELSWSKTWSCKWVQGRQSSQTHYWWQTPSTQLDKWNDLKKNLRWKTTSVKAVQDAPTHTSKGRTEQEVFSFFFFFCKSEIFRRSNRAGKKKSCFVLAKEEWGGTDSEGGTFSRGINRKSSPPTRHCTFQKCKSRGVRVEWGVRGRKREETHESHLLLADSRMMCEEEGAI